MNLSGQSLLIILLVGLIAGWLAGEIVAGGGFGLIGDIIVGIVGALIGGFIYRYFGHGQLDTLWSFIYALIGAVLLLLLLRAFSGRRPAV